MIASPWHVADAIVTITAVFVGSYTFIKSPIIMRLGYNFQRN
ncbi:hypothetical protein EDC56_1120 [Sinobacterium caligoides]|uniref:Uncharacterized protein n=1 Tax=Sinobacterium caligoides TaxID=933926 RepID=A0A3N2E0E2_9GAMM|nr:hypothetical protein EDC56_1120 [Sinobacterium caligoides]